MIADIMEGRDARGTLPQVCTSGGDGQLGDAVGRREGSWHQGVVVEPCSPPLLLPEAPGTAALL